MSCIHYKFRNNSKHDTIQFDGSYITVGEIKQAILGQKKMGKAPDFTLQIINAQTQEAYNDDNQLIPRNADVTVKRIPTGNKVSKSQLAAQSQSLDMYKMSNALQPLAVSMENDLSKTEGTEEDKLKAMMMQQSMAYDNPNVHKRYNKPNPDEEIPLNYVCHRCNTPGHLIKNCPTNGNTVFDSRIPRLSRKMTLSLKKKEAAGPEITPEEKKLMEKNQKSTQEQVKTLAQEAYTNIPPEMKCPICKQLMVDACLATCCGQSFCDECIRDKLLDEALCPACDEEVSPSQLISNNALRVTINKYKKDHSDQIAKLYSECHIRPRSRDSTPKPELVSAPQPLPPSSLASSLPSTKPIVDGTSNLTITEAPKITPPVAILDPMVPPPAVAILPLKEEDDVKPEVKQEEKPPVSIALPPISSYSTLVQPPLPLPAMPLLPFNPLLSGPPLGPPAIGLLPPPLPLPEPAATKTASKDRILDPSEFYAIQKELRRLQDRRSRSRSSSHSPTRRKGTSSDRHRRRQDGKRRQESHNRIRIERTARYLRARSGKSTRDRGPIRGVLERKVRNERAKVDGESRSYDSDTRRSDLSDRKSNEEDRRSEGRVSSKDHSDHHDYPEEKPKKKDHKKKKNKKKDKKDKKGRSNEERAKPSLTEYSASGNSSEEEAGQRSPSPSPFNPIIQPRQASPSPDRIIPTPETSEPASLPEPPQDLSPKPPSDVGTPTAGGGETPQFTNGAVSSDNNDAVSINMNHSDREVNGVAGDSSSSDSDTDRSNHLEELKRKCKETEEQIKQMKEQRLADKKKMKKIKKKKAKKSKDDDRDEKKKKKHKKRKHREDLEDGEIKSKSKKRKRSHSDKGSQESLEIEVKKKSKKSKHKKEHKKDRSDSTKSKDIEIKVNLNSLKMDNGSKSFSISPSAKVDSARRVHLGPSPLKVRNDNISNIEDAVVVNKPKKNRSHKKSKHKISKSAVSGIEDDADV